MNLVVPLSSASSQTLESGFEVPSFCSTRKVSSSLTPVNNYYEIEDRRLSECAMVLFTRKVLSSEKVVMKILRNYKDTRYSLETVDKRQECQLEALERNKIFTPEVYIGLAPIVKLDLDQGHIVVGEVNEKPTKVMLEPDANYALLMHQLPEDRRLDHLLKEKDIISLGRLVQILTEHIGYMHTHLVSSLSSEEEIPWGSYEQLRKKLLHNCALLDLVVRTNERDQRSPYSMLSETIDWLKKTLLQVFMQYKSQRYFELRVRDQRIRHCHGDLKSPNIWVLPYNHSCDEESGQYVKVLDAVDFNPSYSNVDILSDFAMLVIDVQVRTKSASLANEMIETYLELTDQDDGVARSVLGFYLVEKAIIGAAISIEYDNLPDLGLNLLQAAEMRLNCLVNMQHK